MAPANTGQPDPKATPNLRQRRPSTTSVAGTVISTAKQVEAKIESALLVLWDDLPTWRRDNQYILSGYRADSNSYWKSFKSLFYVHNEFVNIWTHLLGALVFPVIGIWLYNIIAPRYASATSMDVLVFSCFFVGAVLCLSMSAAFHMLCNHSPEVAKWGNKLDYSGIVFCIVGSYVPALYYGLFCLPNMLTPYMYGVSATPYRF
jgi:adiponectin receptor